MRRLPPRRCEIPFPTRQHRFQHVQLSLGHGLMHGGEKGLVVKRFNEIGDRPSLYRRVPHQIVVVRRTYDDARLG